MMIAVKSVKIKPDQGGFAISAEVELRQKICGTMFVKENEVKIPQRIVAESSAKLFHDIERYVKGDNV